MGRTYLYVSFGANVVFGANEKHVPWHQIRSNHMEVCHTNSKVLFACIDCNCKIQIIDSDFCIEIITVLYIHI